MDATISTALEEICSRGEAGVSVAALWPALEPSLAAAGLDLSPALKQVVWTALLAVPTLRFRPSAAADPAALSVEAAEELGVTIAAEERLRDSFLGLYNAHSANAAIPLAQRRALQRLAVARKDGITQSQLGKEFGVEGKNLFYVLKNLECQGLIVRRSAVMKTKEACEEGDSINSQSVTTNLVYLSRYAKHLGSQQRFEIFKEEQNAESLGNVEGNSAGGDSLGGKMIKEGVVVKDYLPAMKAVCDKLEKANGKVLVVSDIKKELGYSGAPKHREWRQVCSRLRDAHIVLEFDAIVNEKVERCLRLLKSFSPLSSVSKTRGCVDNDFGDQLKFGKKCQLSNQFVELPIEHQIFDIIESSGSEGLTVIEICKRLGIDNKKNHNRLVSMFSRFGMDLQAENQKKCVVYRVWAPGQRNSESTQETFNKSNAPNDDRICGMEFGNLAVPDRRSDTCSDFEPSNLKGDIVVHEEMKNTEICTDLTAGPPRETESSFLSNNSQEILSESRDMVSEGGLSLASMELGKNNAPSEALSAALKPVSSGTIKRHPFLPLTADSLRREKKILERFQNEKFVLKAELHKWLESLEKDRGSKIDRKTVERLLNKLQQEGHCKCIHINMPYVTNCGGRRTIQVALHPSVESITPELVSEIHDRLRSFEIQIRGQCSSQAKNRDSVPILKDVQRTKIQTNTDAIALKSEAMRANGFVLAKMIRAKLLHGFLWEHVYGSGGSNGALSSTRCAFELINTNNDSKLFSLESAIKAIPIELFLQVVGSTQTFDSMIEKCRRGLCLSDLHVQEYKSLMDTHATGRLSLIVEILRRLKLIRIVSGECPKDGDFQAAFTHSLELKPYIEEPISKDAVSLRFRPLDLRPRIRHDFVLSNRKAVDEYWQTLEYCYAAADPRAALHAFPGSAVHEVFLLRSWASVRVMTADQRAELLKRVMKDDQSGKLSFKDCGKIAKELNLSLEQVLRVYYDKRQSRLNKFSGEGDGGQKLRSNRLSSLRKRERSPEVRSAKLRKVGEVTGELEEQKLATSSDTVDSLEGEFLVSPGKHEMDLQKSQEADHVENEGDPEQNEDDDTCYSVINRSSLSKVKPARQKRFSWTEEADRQLVIQYARHRAALGAKYHRTDWASISDLPAPPSTCKKRMSLLNNNAKFRKAVMRLCNTLSERYVKLLEKDDCRSQDSFCEGVDMDSYDGNLHTQGTVVEDPWDDFDNSNIKVALDEVLRCKWMAKPEASERVGFICEESSDLSMNAKEYESDVIAGTSSVDVQNHKKKSLRRSRARRLHRKFIKLLNEEVKVSREVHKSLAISNAVELFKLIFLSTSTASAVPDMLAGILRCYSEHDLFAAFNYLREKKFMVGGNGNQPFSLSQHFMHSVSKSPFPANSGTRATKFANWLHERERDLTGGLDLSADLQCGDICHLFALVSSGQLSITSCLPDEGVGEAEDIRSLKRKIDFNEFLDGDKAKKLRSLVSAEGEIISRREKGFPGIMVSINRTRVLTADAVNLFGAENTCTGEQSIAGNITFETTSESTVLSHFNHVKEMLDSNNNVSVVDNSNKSPWIVMASYASCLLPQHSNNEVSGPVDPEVFSSLCAAFRKAGDQGLSIEEVSQIINIPGEKMPELIISVLLTFGRALKVNAFDSVHIVDASYRSKYSLISAADICQDLKAPSWAKTMRCDSSDLVLDPENHHSGGTHAQGETNISADAVHKVSVLNFPEEANESYQTSSLQDCCVQQELVSPGGDRKYESFYSFESCVPILPWINGDGTINKGIYKGLRRRVIGIVMQNPGILEDNIINQMDVLNPQSCRKLLELMILDKHLYVKKMHQTTSNAPPPILRTLFKSKNSIVSESKLVCREHFFANPLSTSLL